MLQENNKNQNLRVMVLTLAGILINHIGAKLALLFDLPLFLDSIGTVLAAVLGGYLPGIIAGFLSNLFNGITDPITLYYGILSIFIAVLATYLARRGVFRSLPKTLGAGVLFALIGGGLGSVLTWLLYGFSFGSGISAPYAEALFAYTGLSKFYAQFTADMLIDLVDKLVTVLLVFLALRLMPDRWFMRFPLGVCSIRSAELPPVRHVQANKRKPMHSLKTEVLLLIAVSSSVLCILATTISVVIYWNTMNDHYAEVCQSAARLMQMTVDGDEIDRFLEQRDESDPVYAETERRLSLILESFPDVEYLYVYQLREDGCHVVFDLDTPELEGEALGTVLSYDEAFLDYRGALLDGERIEPVISNDTYGWLLTAYEPLLDSEGNCVAYTAADIAMSDVMTDRYVFIIKMTTLLFAGEILLVMVAIWFAERRLIEPVNAITDRAERFVYASETERAHSVDRMNQLDIRTGNEIELLYHAITQSVTDIAAYIGTIDNLQANTMLGFANLVESRDRCTGEHIRRTAAIVRELALQLKADSQYVAVLTDEYIDSLEKCAPLHDLGKIKISDTLLNKPGKLTPEEFEIMKTHTTAGREIINGLMEKAGDASLTYLCEAAEMAACHHEWWDGRGYPAGLKEADIPLSARIMAVADVYDALISARSYKAAFAQESAREIIRDEAGTHFDPVVVEAFEQAFERIRKL